MKATQRYLIETLNRLRIKQRPLSDGGGRPHSAQREPIPALSLANCLSQVSRAHPLA